MVILARIKINILINMSNLVINLPFLTIIQLLNVIVTLPQIMCIIARKRHTKIKNKNKKTFSFPKMHKIVAKNDAERVYDTAQAYARR